MTYRCASDGTKLSVVGADGRGYEYYGSLIYQRNGSSLTFESAGFNEGRIYSGGAYYHVKDHLGSIRLVMDQTGSVKEQNDYYPFGMRQERSNYALFAGNRFKYNGKEEQTTGGLGYLDYGARMYDAESGRWFGVDPLLEKYYGLSPYAYCGNNPLIYTDPDGMVIKLSKMTEEQTSLYDCILRELLSSSKLFKTMYTELENSNAIYVIRFGQTSLDPDGNPVQGDFMPNKDGQGGTITFFLNSQVCRHRRYLKNFFMHFNRTIVANMKTESLTGNLRQRLLQRLLGGNMVDMHFLIME